MTPSRVRKAAGAGGSGREPDAGPRLSPAARLGGDAPVPGGSRGDAGVECVVGQQLPPHGPAWDRIAGWIRVEPRAGRNLLTVEVSTSLAPALPVLLPRLRGLFDLDARPEVIAEHLVVRSRRWPGGCGRCPGLRVPGCIDGFEMAVRAILGQRISVPAATTLAGRLASAFGEPVSTPHPRPRPAQSPTRDAGRGRGRIARRPWASPRRGPGPSASWPGPSSTGGSASSRAPIPRPRSSDSRHCPGSATGPPITSPCGPSAGPTPSPPPTSACCGPRG